MAARVKVTPIPDGRRGIDLPADHLDFPFSGVPPTRESGQRPRPSTSPSPASEVLLPRKLRSIVLAARRLRPKVSREVDGHYERIARRDHDQKAFIKGSKRRATRLRQGPAQRESTRGPSAGSLYLIHSAQLMCIHGGRGPLLPPPRRSLYVQSSSILTDEGFLIKATIVGCAQIGTGHKPCTEIVADFLDGSFQIKVDGETSILVKLKAMTDGVATRMEMALTSGRSNAQVPLALPGVPTPEEKDMNTPHLDTIDSLPIGALGGLPGRALRKLFPKLAAQAVERKGAILFRENMTWSNSAIANRATVYGFGLDVGRKHASGFRGASEALKQRLFGSRSGSTP